MALKPALAIMAKEPAPGRTKTRLCPPLTVQQAALYEALLWDTVALAHAVPGVQVAIAVTPPKALPRTRRFLRGS